VLVAVSHQVGDLKDVRHEVTIGVADIAAVEPDIALLGDAVEAEPAATLIIRNGGVESGAMQYRSLARHSWDVGPVAGNIDLVPTAVVEIGLVEGAPQFLRRRCCSPRPRQVHP